MRPPALLLALLVLPAHPQAPKAADPYAAESFVVLRSDTSTVMAADGTGTTERTIAVRIQSEAALRELGVVTLAFASASEHVDILYARVRRPDGTSLETPVADALEQPAPVTKEAPFYSDLKEKQLPVKSLRVGDTLEWKARTVRTKAEAPGNFWGQQTALKDVVSLNETYELRYPKSVPVTVWTNPAAALKPVESDAGSDHIYTWSVTSLKPTAGPEAEAAKEAKKHTLLTPAEELDNREGTLPTLAWTTFPTWAAVGAWYRGLEAGRATPDDAIKARVAELTAGKTTDEEKVRAVYAFVAPQIRYIGVAFGIGRYQPHHADEILENQYGDCKDKHTLLASMLLVLGLHPDAVLIGEGIRFNPAVPSPEAFNHLITHVTVAGQPVWLDATAEVAPYRMLSYDLRDKPSLVIPDAPAVPAIERTPADPPFPTFTTFTATGSIDKEGVSNSRITLTMRGDAELLFRAAVRQVPPAQYPDMVQRISQNIGYSGTTSHPEVSRPDDTSTPFTLSYDYRREQGTDWVNTRVVPQFAPASFPVFDDKDPPITAINLGVPGTTTSTAQLKLPEHWTAQLPEAVHEKSTFATYDETYRLQAGTVYSERRIVILQQFVPAADYKTYKKWTDSIHAGDEEYIVLIRPAGEKPSGSPAASTAPSNSEAARLLLEAGTAIDANQFDTPGPLVDRAAKLNPDQQNLWGIRGALSFHRGEMSEAIADYQHELALHPESLWVYPMLITCQVNMGHRPEALASLRRWSAAAPSDPKPSLGLIAMLLEDKQPAEAVTVATNALAALPAESRNNPDLQLALGRAQLAAGQRDQGAVTLTAILDTSDSPLALNNAAYELADATPVLTAQLPAAETATRKALTRLDAESQAWTLDENPATLRQQTGLILNTWDTLAWIFFREGKFDDALTYENATWLNRPDATVGEHLGDIQSALKDRNAALHSYQLALAALPTHNAMGVKIGDTPEKQRLEVKIKTAKSGGAKSPLAEPEKDGPAALMQVRTLNLGSAAAGHIGSAEYLVLIDRDHAQKAQPTGNKSIPGGTDLILKAPMPNLIPAGSSAKLACLAILNCEANTCALIWEP